MMFHGLKTVSIINNNISKNSMNFCRFCWGIGEHFQVRVVIDKALHDLCFDQAIIGG